MRWVDVYNENCDSLKNIISQGFLVRLSIITSIIHKIIADFVNINLTNENVISREMIFSKIVSHNDFGILIYIFFWKFYFRYMYFRLMRRNNKIKINNYLMNNWRNNWRSVIDTLENLSYDVLKLFQLKFGQFQNRLLT